MRSVLALAAIVVGLSPSLVGCGGLAVPNRPGVHWETLRPKPISAPGSAPFPSQQCRDFAAGLVKQMTLEEKLGQMVQADYQRLRGPSDVWSAGLGSVLNGGGESPRNNTPREWVKWVTAVREQANETPLGIPLLYGVDAVHGHNNVKGAVLFPHNVGLGASRDAELVRRVARATAEEVAATGMNWTFAPVFAASRDERWGRSYESFGETPELAAELGRAAVIGYQTERLGSSPTSILACAKHFAGDGGTRGGVDRGDTPGPEAEFRKLHVDQYKAAIEAGVGSIMVSYSSYAGAKMHGHKRLLTDVLKGELGFDGFLVSDFEAVEQLPGGYPEQVKSALNAGVDMVMAPKRHGDFIGTVRSLVNGGAVPIGRVDDAARRILTVKCELGASRYEEPPVPLSTVGSLAHRALGREAVGKSLVLLKNEGNVLPLKRPKKLLVAGKHADDIGLQSGGWSISWNGAPGRITPGTTILQGLREVAGPNVEIVHDVAGRGASGADAAIVVIGEEPYAEKQGDRTSLALTSLDSSIVEGLSRTGVPIVVVLITGRPLILDAVAEKADAIVVAWLPGTEGAGVADVLFGKRPVSGKLPVSWPRSMAQIPINVGDRSYDPLFPFGQGLLFGAPAPSGSVDAATTDAGPR